MLTGANGQVGWELQRTLMPLGQVLPFTHQSLDLANPDMIRKKAREVKPDLIVNAAAYTAVDQAESESELAMAVNGVAPGILAEEAKRMGAGLIHYSTDYVFDGAKNTPYVETDTPNPMNVYGRTKLAGESAIASIEGEYLIFRTSWVYGLRGKNFLLTILRLIAERPELRIVDDQTGAPTWSRFIAEVTAAVVSKCSNFSEVAGLYHLSGAGSTTWRGFTEAIVDGVALRGNVARPKVVPIGSSEYPTAARRPMFSLLEHSKITRVFGIISSEWVQQLELCLDDMSVTLKAKAR